MFVYRSSGSTSSANTPMPTTLTLSWPIGAGVSLGGGPFGWAGTKVTEMLVADVEVVVVGCSTVHEDLVLGKTASAPR